MNIKIRDILDKGVFDKERLVLDVTAACDIGEFAVFAGIKRRGLLSNEVRFAFWFPDAEIKEGDLVVLYTKRGAKAARPNRNGSSSYFFYWGLDKSIWSQESDCPILLNIRDWVA